MHINPDHFLETKQGRIATGRASRDISADLKGALAPTQR
jgi:hypothetical protein